ncbi:hypothetical protein ACHAWF_018109 [Thalassiosira exigua]
MRLNRTGELILEALIHQCYNVAVPPNPIWPKKLASRIGHRSTPTRFGLAVALDEIRHLNLPGDEAGVVKIVQPLV